LGVWRCDVGWSFNGFASPERPRSYDEPFMPVQTLAHASVPLLVQTYVGLLKALQEPQPNYLQAALDLRSLETALTEHAGISKQTIMRR